MARTALVGARIDASIKDEAVAVLGTFGLTVSDAIRMTLLRVAHDGALPSELKIPNAETQAAMAESRAMAAARRSRRRVP